MINGIDVSNLAIDTPIEFPVTVPGRTLQVDADQLCYLAGCYDDDPFADAKRNFHSILDTWMVMSGSEFMNLHMTGDNKGDRFDIANVKEYQANRKGKQKPKHLSAMREYCREQPNCVFHDDQEADDGMAQCNYLNFQVETPNLSVICSADKDLKMCSGWHLDQQTGELRYVDGYGEIELVEGKAKKIKGYGTSFFWAQLLMGDTADNIPGLPKLGSDTQVRYEGFHTKALVKLLDKCAQGDDKAADKISQLKPKACGAVATWHILHDCKDDEDAFSRVMTCYWDYYGTEPFEAMRWDGKPYLTTTGAMLVEQMELLWMRRVKGRNDIMNFVEGIQDGKTWTD